jgi:uncharacterized protein (DUF2141 family)
VWTGAALARFLSFGMPLPTTETCSLAVHVDGFRNGKGVIGGAVFQDQTGWPEDDERAFTRTAVPVAGNSSVVLTFPDLPEGRYGIVVLHDENANHRLDRNIFRVPKEGFGFANNPHVGLSAPSWKESSVQVGCPATEVHIHLIYK